MEEQIRQLRSISQNWSHTRLDLKAEIEGLEKVLGAERENAANARTQIAAQKQRQLNAYNRLQRSLVRAADQEGVLARMRQLVAHAQEQYVHHRRALGWVPKMDTASGNDASTGNEGGVESASSSSSSSSSSSVTAATTAAAGSDARVSSGGKTHLRVQKTTRGRAGYAPPDSPVHDLRRRRDERNREREMARVRARAAAAGHGRGGGEDGAGDDADDEEEEFDELKSLAGLSEPDDRPLSNATATTMNGGNDSIASGSTTSSSLASDGAVGGAVGGAVDEGKENGGIDEDPELADLSFNGYTDSESDGLGSDATSATEDELELVRAEAEFKARQEMAAKDVQRGGRRGRLAREKNKYIFTDQDTGEVHFKTRRRPRRPPGPRVGPRFVDARKFAATKYAHPSTRDADNQTFVQMYDFKVQTPKYMSEGLEGIEAEVAQRALDLTSRTRR